MAVNPISASTALQGKSLGMQDLFKVMLTQLTYQDPLKPMDNQQFIAQIAQFTALQATQALNEQMGQLIVAQSATQTIGLLGRNVEANVDGRQIAGTVVSMSMEKGSPLMTLKDANGKLTADVAFAQIISVR